MALICDRCNKQLTCKGRLTKHIRHMHTPGESLSCDLCLRPFQTKSDMGLHFEVQHGRLYKHKCCGKTFRNRLTLRAHQRTNHTSKRTKFECDKCANTYGYKENLALHIWALHGTKPIAPKKKPGPKPKEKQPKQCDICCKYFTESYNLQIHLNATHKNSSISWQCDKCGTNCAKRGDLAKHIFSVHWKLRQYNCNLCAAQFTRHETRSQHIKNTHHPKTHICDQCSMKFNHKETLKRHFVQVHFQNPSCTSIETKTGQSIWLRRM